MNEAEVLNWLDLKRSDEGTNIFAIICQEEFEAEFENRILLFRFPLCLAVFKIARDLGSEVGRGHTKDGIRYVAKNDNDNDNDRNNENDSDGAGNNDIGGNGNEMGRLQ